MKPIAAILALCLSASAFAQSPLPPLPSMTVANVTAYGTVLWGDANTVMVVGWSSLPILDVRPGLVDVRVHAIVTKAGSGGFTWAPSSGFPLSAMFLGFFWSSQGLALSPTPGRLTVDSGLVGQPVYLILSYTINPSTGG